MQSEHCEWNNTSSAALFVGLGVLFERQDSNAIFIPLSLPRGQAKVIFSKAPPSLCCFLSTLVVHSPQFPESPVR
jgi:hypothetical protein